MVRFEVVNELTLKVTANAGDQIFTKAGAFICGENNGPKNYTFEKVLLGPEQNGMMAFMGQLGRRLAGENIPLMKVSMRGDSTTYYANYAQHVVAYHLSQGEVLSVESENLLAFTSDCKYGLRFLGSGILSQKGLATTTLSAMGPNAFAAVLLDGNPIMLSNMQNGQTLEVDPDAVVCWITNNAHSEPNFKTDVSWKSLLGQHSGESYMFEWNNGNRATVLIQPNERSGGIRVGID